MVNYEGLLRSNSLQRLKYRLYNDYTRKLTEIVDSIDFVLIRIRVTFFKRRVRNIVHIRVM